MLVYPDVLIAHTREFNGKIVFTVDRIKENYSHIFMLNGKTVQTVQLTKTGNNGWPQWSPDGQKIVFASSGRPEHRNREIYIMDANGKYQRRLTYTTGGNARDPRWGPDGKTIYYHSAVKGSIQENILDLTTERKQTVAGIEGIPDVKAINIDDFMKEFQTKSGKEQKQTAKEWEAKKKGIQEWFERARGMFEVYPSPDEKYKLLRYDINSRLVLLDFVNGAQKELSSDAGLPAWSKDSKKIAYVEGWEPDYTNFTIYNIGKDKSDKLKIKNPDKGNRYRCGGKLTWSKDSRYIMYSCGIEISDDPAEPEEPDWLYILDLETMKSEKLIQGSSPDWY